MQLRSVSLTYCAISPRSLKILSDAIRKAKCPHLEYLDLSYNDCTSYDDELCGLVSEMEMIDTRYGDSETGYVR